MRRDKHPYGDIPETDICPGTHGYMGPNTLGIAEFLEWEAIHLSIMLGRCRAFTIICQKCLSGPD